MNSFTIVFSLVLYALTFLCFYIPYKCGDKSLGQASASVLAIIITISLFGNIDVLVIFIYPFIVIFQLVFICYWTFKFFGKGKIGLILTWVLSTVFLLLLLSPWISDLMFNKKDVIKILLYHGIELRDDFQILKNETSGWRDYYETFTLKLTDNDFNSLVQKITTSKNYKGRFYDDNNLPSADYQKFDTIDFESPNHFERESFSKQKMNNGTYHFRFQLEKQSKELSYIGSDE